MRGKDFNTGLRGTLFEAKHYERMSSSVWLYGWLILRQTRQDGTTGWVLGGKPISYSEIEEETGFPPRTLERWMRVLRKEKATSKRGRLRAASSCRLHVQKSFGVGLMYAILRRGPAEMRRRVRRIVDTTVRKPMKSLNLRHG